MKELDFIANYGYISDTPFGVVGNATALFHMDRLINARFRRIVFIIQRRIENE